MKSAPFTALVMAIAACSSPPTASTPALSNLMLTPTATAGSTEVGTFQISNSAGFTGLTLDLELSAPGVSAPSVDSAPLEISGAIGTTEATGQVNLELPPNAAHGTYNVSVSVNDGSYASNALAGSFDVN